MGSRGAARPHPTPAPSGCDIEDIARCFPNTAGMGQLARLDDTLYSFGTACCFNDFFRPVGWRLTDGEAWDAIQSQSAFFGFGGVLDVAASDTALVVSTSYGLGATFTRLALDIGHELGRNQPDGRVTAICTASTTSPGPPAASWPSEPRMPMGIPSRPRVWSSSDGLTWTPATAPEDAAHLYSVSGTSAGFHRARRDGRGYRRLDRVGSVRELGLVRTLLGLLPRFAIRPICASRADRRAR